MFLLDSSLLSQIITPLILMYCISLACAAVILKLVKKKLRENSLKLIIWIAVTTTLIFGTLIIDSVGSRGILTGLVMFALYYLIFTNKFNLSEKQAVAGALAFAILLNPFFYAHLYELSNAQNASNMAMRYTCISKLTEQTACYNTSGSWNPNGHVIEQSVITTCLKVSENDKHVTNGSCENCSFCFDNVNNPTYVCCGPTHS